MRLKRVGHAIGAILIGLALLLSAPDSGVSQEIVRSGLSADKPLSYHLSALHGNSWLTRYGIWVRHEGMWAFRPTVRPDWQAYFRCQAGYGCGGVGQASRLFGSWLPYGYAGWDFVPGGWMWFPGQRLASSRAWDLFWDLWFFNPSYSFGTYGFGPQLPTPFAPTRWDAVLDRPGQDRDGWKPPTDASTRGQPRPLVDPVRAVPVVTVSADGKDSRSSSRKAPQKPAIDAVPPVRPVETLFEPMSIQRARQKGLRRPGTSRLASQGLRLESPRTFEPTNPWVYRNRITTGIDRMPSPRSWPGATHPQSEGYRPARPESNGRSHSAGRNRAPPKQ